MLKVATQEPKSDSAPIALLAPVIIAIFCSSIAATLILSGFYGSNSMSTHLPEGGYGDRLKVYSGPAAFIGVGAFSAILLMTSLRKEVLMGRAPIAAFLFALGYALVCYALWTLVPMWHFSSLVAFVGSQAIVTEAAAVHPFGTCFMYTAILCCSLLTCRVRKIKALPPNSLRQISTQLFLTVVISSVCWFFKYGSPLDIAPFIM